VLVQGATMARTPIIAAWLLPAPGADEDDGWPDATAAGDVVPAVPLPLRLLLKWPLQ